MIFCLCRRSDFPKFRGQLLSFISVSSYSWNDIRFNQEFLQLWSGVTRMIITLPSCFSSSLECFCLLPPVQYYRTPSIVLQVYCLQVLILWQTKTVLKSRDITLPIKICISSVAQSCPTLCDAIECSMPGLPVHHQLPEFTKTHVHWVGDVIQPTHPLPSPSPPTFNLSQHQGLFQWVSSSHQVAKVSQFQLQHQSFQWIFRTDFL